MFRVGVIAALALAAAAPAAGVLPHSGLKGVVHVGPTTPVCMVGQPCSAPVQTTLVFTRRGRHVSIPTDADGNYRALLVPGIYDVATKPKIGFGGLRPARVKVRSDHVDHLDFFADTGIR